MVGVYLLSILPVAVSLNRVVQQIPALDLNSPELSQCGAVVVLGGGVRKAAPNRQGAWESSDGSLARVDYAAVVALQTGLPVLVCGGTDKHLEHTEAFAMAGDLRDLGVTDVWLEAKSNDTAENAAFGSEILSQRGVGKIILVTSATHMGRATGAFESHGVEVVQAPMHFETRSLFDEGAFSLLPRAGDFATSCGALESVLAALWYKIRY